MTSAAKDCGLITFAPPETFGEYLRPLTITVDQFIRVLRALASDIRFWILVFFMVRMIGVTYPPIEVYHNWRQTGTLMTVRAMQENGPDLFFPKTDIAGFDKSDVVASEFPIYNFVIHLVNELFGVDDWYGRLINLILSSFGVWCFFLMMRRVFGKNVGFMSSLILLASLWFMFSRKVMPDIFSASSVIIGVELAWQFRLRSNWFLLLASGLFLAMGLLAKMPSAVLLALLVPLLFDRGASGLHRLAIGIVSALATGLMIWWYFHWVPVLIGHGGFQLYWPKTFAQGWSELMARTNDTAYRIYFTALYSYGAFAFFLVGLFFIRKERYAVRAMIGLVVLMLAFFMLKTGDAFPEQDYYMIPFVPFMAVIAALGLQRIEQVHLRAALLAFVVGEGVLNQQHDLHWPEEMEYKLELEGALRPFSEAGEPIAFISDLNPSDMYFSNHPGWLVSPNEIHDEPMLRRMTESGCKIMVVNNKKEWLRTAIPDLPVIDENEYWRVYALPVKP